MKKIQCTAITLPLLAAGIIGLAAGLIAGLAACPSDVEIKPPLTSIEGLQATLEEAITLRDSLTPAENGDTTDVDLFYVSQDIYDDFVGQITAAQGEASRIAAAPYLKIDVTYLNNLLAAIDAVDAVKAGGNRSLPPEASITTVAKEENGDTSISFTLTSSHEADSTWNIYTQAEGGSPQTGYNFTFNEGSLTITASSALATGDYYLAVTDPAEGRTESRRLKLTIAPSPGETIAPSVTNDTYRGVMAAAIKFTLATAYEGAVTLKVYTNQELTTVSSDVSAAVSGTTLTLSKTGGVPFGSYWITAKEGSSYESPAVKLTVEKALTLVSAEVDLTRTPQNQVVKVVFDSPIESSSLAFNKFEVKVNEYPTKRYGTDAANTEGKPWLDLSLKTTRTITAGTVEGNAVFLTMNEPAKHGEVLRLATTDAGAVTATSGEALANVSSGLIIKNLVPRVKHNIEGTPGFHMVKNSDGTVTQPVADATGANVWYKAIEYFYKTRNPQDGYTYYIVIGQDQAAYTSVDTAGGIGAWWGMGSANTTYGLVAKDFTYSGTQRATVVLTTNADYAPNKTITVTAASPNVLSLIDGVDFILDGSVTLKNMAGSGEGVTLGLGDGGRLILDKGTIEGKTQTYARGLISAPQDLAYGIFVIINGGEIKGMKSMLAPVALGPNSIFVMHGGTISGNEATAGTGDYLNTLKAGAVGIRPMGQTSNNYGGSLQVRQAGSIGFYMTGGEIKDNKAAIGNHSASGAVLTSGEFQKTGGSLSGNTISGGSSVNNKAANFVVLKTSGTNPAVGSSYVNNDATGSGTAVIILECVKTGASVEPTFRKPDWANGSFSE